MSFDLYLPKGQRTPEWYNQFADKFADSLTMDRSEGAEVIRELANHMSIGIAFLDAINDKLKVVENCLEQINDDTLSVPEHWNDIHKGDSVAMPEPEEGDSWSQSFSGTVAGFKKDTNGTYLIVVEDSEGDCFDVEAERILQE